MRLWKSAAVSLGVLCGIGFVSRAWQQPSQPLVGSADEIARVYAAWRANHGSQQDVIEFGWSRAFSTEPSSARGRALFDVGAGQLRLELDGAEPDDAFDVWLVDNGAEGTAAPEPCDAWRFIGTLRAVDGRATFVRELGDPELLGFDADLVVAARHGAHPTENVVLVGMPSLFQRLASRERHARGRAPSGLLLAAATTAPFAATPPAQLAALVAQGEQLFFAGTFGGNGRACGTCHPAQNNFTIDPTFIATLPPNDPLFVAENVPALDSTRNGGLPFENPVLMRQFGLILENLDGFDDLPQRFTMRSVPHVLGLGQTMTAPAIGGGPVQRTGWSGDGAPGQGSLREFALGAVRQHYTRTMARRAGVDFRFPTDAELDALEAFQLSLGRGAELDLATLVLRDTGARRGRNVFDVAGCAGCHANAGANRGEENLNFATGTEAFVRHHPDGTGELRPPDGGLGTNGSGGNGTVIPTPEPDDPAVLSFGDKTFNVPSLVELADTLPAFHNNLTLLGVLPNTVEGAIAFYDTIEFRDSPSGFIVNFQPGEIEDLGRFLRVVNALENRRSADVYVARAVELLTPFGDPALVARALDLAQAECRDAIEVLEAVGLHTHDAVEAFVKADLEIEAARSGPRTTRIATLNRVRSRYLEIARTSMQQ